MYNKINLSAFIKKLFKYINVTSIIITILVTFNFFEFLKSPILFIIYSFIFNFYYSIIIFIKIILTFIYLITFSTFKYLIFLINGELYCLNLTTKNIFTSYNNLIINCSTISDVMNISMSLFDTVLNQNFNKININNLKLNSNQIIIVLESIRNWFFNAVSYLIYSISEWSQHFIYIIIDDFKAKYNDYLNIIKPLIQNQNDGFVDIIFNIFKDFKIIISKIFFIIFSIQIVSVVYYQIYKNLNYRTIFNIINIILFIQIHLLSILYVVQYEMIFTLTHNINNNMSLLHFFTIKIDKLALIFLITVYVISFFVHLYQFLYMYDNPNKEKFLVLINIFILSMLLIVISANWLLLLFAWEILGQSSFFLISFYKNKPSSFKSGYKAFFFNKISDIFLVLAFVLYFKIYQNLNYLNLEVTTHYMNIIGVLILVTALIKSAQFIFYFWLPDSMEAPVPASALIHSATLVSAGIYLTLRFILFMENNIFVEYILFISAPITMVLASLIALNQTDIKRLLAYSTISNCAFIYLLILLKNYELAQFYFILHGVVKSFSFIVAGFLIQQQNHNQDIRNWEIINKSDKLASFILILALLLLATTPLSIIYNIKTNINLFNTKNSYETIFISSTLLIYSINSYLYGLKPLLLILNKKYTLIKLNKHSDDNSNLVYNNIKIITFYYLYIMLIILLMYNYLQININNFFNLQWLITLIILSVIIVYTNNNISKLWVLLNITSILIFIIFI